MPSIVVGDLYAKGAPRTTVPEERTWPRGGGVVEKLTTLAMKDFVECTFARFTSQDRDPAELEFAAPVSWTRCNYGGRRPWFHCVREGCNRRVARLYVVDESLQCRVCTKARYRSQILEPRERRRARANAIRRALGRPAPNTRLPTRPPGMHWTTFERLLDELYEIQYEDGREEDMRLRRMSWKQKTEYFRQAREEDEPIGFLEIAAETLYRVARARERELRQEARVGGAEDVQ